MEESTNEKSEEREGRVKADIAVLLPRWATDREPDQRAGLRGASAVCAPGNVWEMQAGLSGNRHPQRTLLLNGSWADESGAQCTDTREVATNINMDISIT